MPKRQSVQRIQSTTIQGKDSWVEFKRFTLGESKALQADKKEHEGDEEWQQAHGERLLCDHIAAWNWVDDNDQPMPLPRDDASIIDQLTDDELGFLMNLFNSKVDQKN